MATSLTVMLPATVAFSAGGQKVTLTGDVDFDADKVTIKTSYEMIERLMYSLNMTASEQGVEAIGSEVKLENLGGLVDDLSVYLNLQAENMAVDPRVSAAIAGVSWDSPYGTAGLEGGMYSIPVGQEQVQAEQVHVKLKFDAQDAQNIIKAIF